MKQIIKICALAVGLSVSVLPMAAQAQSGCYADYKAKRSHNGNMQLHYGVVQLGQRACNNPGRISGVISRRIGSDGWTLLRVVSTFDQSGLQQRRGNAGQYFLRY